MYNYFFKAWSYKEKKQKLKKEEKDSKDIDKLFIKNKITHIRKRWGTL